MPIAPLVLLSEHFQHPFVFLQEVMLRRYYRSVAAHATPSGRVIGGKRRVLDQVSRDQGPCPAQARQAMHSHRATGALDNLQEPFDNLKRRGGAVGEEEVVELEADLEKTGN